MEREKLNKNRYIVLVIFIIIVVIFFLTPYGKNLFKSILEIFSSSQSLQEYIKKYGVLAPIVFIIIQLLQVIIAPIPGNITTLAGGALFGVWKGFIYGSLGIYIGSTIAYWIARFYGKPLVIKLMSKATYDRYSDTFIGRSFFVLLTVFLFPFFPDDALCLIAGVSKIKFGLFIILVIVGRTPSILLTSYIGAGIIKLFLWQWIVIGIISLFIIILSIKYGEKVETFFKKIYKRL